MPNDIYLKLSIAYKLIEEKCVVVCFKQYFNELTLDGTVVAYPLQQ